MRADCKRIRRWINDWIDGRLTRPRCLEVKAHLAECSACAECAREMASLVRSLKTTPVVAAPEEVLTGVVRRLSASSAAPLNRAAEGAPRASSSSSRREKKGGKRRNPPRGGSRRKVREETAKSLRQVRVWRTDRIESVRFRMPMAVAFVAALALVSVSLFFVLGDGFRSSNAPEAGLPNAVDSGSESGAGSPEAAGEEFGNQVVENGPIDFSPIEDGSQRTAQGAEPSGSTRKSSGTTHPLVTN